jgi:tetratricopeptide (TPR) repeat protein
MRVLLFILVLVFTIPAQDHSADAALMAGKGEYEKALETYRFEQKGVSSGESAARAHYNIGVCLYRLDRPADAVPELTEAIHLRAGGYQRAWYALGMAQTALNHTGEAKEAFTRAVELNGKDAEAWFDLGLTLIETKDFPAARDAFRNAVRFGSVNSADAHNNIGVIHAMSGNITEAVKEFEISGSVEAAGNLKYCREHSGRVAFAGEAPAPAR